MSREGREPLWRSVALAALAGALLGGVLLSVYLLGRGNSSPAPVSVPGSTQTSIPASSTVPPAGGGVLVNPVEGELGEQVDWLVACMNTELTRNGGMVYVESGRTDEPEYQELLVEAQIACASSQPG